MDKLTTISATLFMAADVFAIISLSMPDWIVTDVGGNYFKFLFYGALALDNGKNLLSPQKRDSD